MTGELSGCWARRDGAPRWDDRRYWRDQESAYVYACLADPGDDPLGLCPAHRARYDRDVFALEAAS